MNISDVIEVIQTTDPGFVECNGVVEQKTDDMILGGNVEAVKAAVVGGGRAQPHVEIVEQPASKALRFRYECEGRSAGSMSGVNSTPANKTFPSIRIVGYKGRAKVVVSCVTKDIPHRPHPHNLVGKEGCERGICKVDIASENMMVTFASLGIQCVKKKDIEEALRVREEIRVDPFRTGFQHKWQPTSIDLNAVRLCFQVFLEGGEKGKFNVSLPPIVSNTIYDKKAMSDLIICKLSHSSASVVGGIQMILLCEKVAKEDIQVRFFEEQNGQTIWEGFGDFQPKDVYKQIAIAFKTPSYRTQEVDQPIQVYIQLKRPSDGVTSKSLPFQMLPLSSDDPDSLKRKRQKLNNDPGALVLKRVQAEAKKHATMADQSVQCNFKLVKLEPVERGPSTYGSPYGGDIAAGGSPLYPVGTTSPQPSAGMQSLRPQNSPGRAPSPMEYAPYNIPFVPPQPNMLQQYQTHHNRQSMPPISASTHQQLPYLQQQRHEEPHLLYKVTPVKQETGFQQFNPAAADMEVAAGVSSVLDMDSRQHSSAMSLDQLDSAELAFFGTALSEHFSSGLSISDPVEL